MEHQKATPCHAFEEDLVLFHYGDLSGAERDRLAAHVAGCAGCAGYLQELATLLPLTVKSDAPPEQFWLDYKRELRHKIDDASERKSRWWNWAALMQPRYLPAFATAALVVLALTFTLGKGPWSAKNQAADDEMLAALPVAENLEFFSAMDVLDDMDLLDVVGNPANNAS
jgi:hypothetical protein